MWAQVGTGNALRASRYAATMVHVRTPLTVAMLVVALGACETKPKVSEGAPTTGDQSTTPADDKSMAPSGDKSRSPSDDKQRQAAEERRWRLQNQTFCDAVLDRNTVEAATGSQSLGTRPAAVRSMIAECHYVTLPPTKPGFVSLVTDCRSEHPRLKSMRAGFSTWKNKQEVDVAKGGVRMKSPDSRTTQVVFETVQPPCAVYLIGHDMDVPLMKLAGHVVDHLSDVDVPVSQPSL